MKKTYKYLTVLVLGSALPLYQNYIDLSLYYPQTPTAAPTDQDINLGQYGLIRSDTLSILPDPALTPPPNGGSTDADDRVLTKAYSPYLTYKTTNVEKDDVFVVMAVVEMTHQPQQSETSVAQVGTYIDCNNTAASPIVQKSLKRSRGNHHGSVSYNGLCALNPVPAGGATIRLMAKSDLANGIIHRGGQPKRVVNH